MVVNSTKSAQIVLISAVASGQGKTTITAALARKLVRAGLRVRVFKIGPDFLDPKILERASGAPVYSLDLWMVGLDQSRRQLAQAAAVADVILIEGVMGLYDGAPSSADLARAFGVPVLVVLDVGAMAQTCGALALGLRDYGAINLVGVIANRVASVGHAEMIKSAMNDIALLATMPSQQQSLPERHLGLVQADEVNNLDALLDNFADQLELDMAQWDRIPRVQIELTVERATVHPALSGKLIAIARDAAFNFIYPANLDCLTEQGAQLIFFSPLANEPIPDGADAVYLPGGYPELHAEILSNAQVWQESIRQAHRHGVPIWAECGGMMSLADQLVDLDGKTWVMAGLLSGSAIMQKRLAGLGMQGLTSAVGELRGHTFHYSTLSTAVTPVAHTFKQHDGTSIGEAVYKVGSLTASYFHAYFPSCPVAVAILLKGEF